MQLSSMENTSLLESSVPRLWDMPWSKKIVVSASFNFVDALDNFELNFTMHRNASCKLKSYSQNCMNYHQKLLLKHLFGIYSPDKKDAEEKIQPCCSSQPKAFSMR